MAARLGGQNISTLLETLPGIASVLRSPVADAIASMIRAGAGLSDFREADANELVQYAVRRGLMDSEEGEAILEEIKAAAPKGRAKSAKKASKKKTAKKAAKQTPAKAVKKKSTVKAVKRPAKKTSKASSTRSPSSKAKNTKKKKGK
ncbi:MAG: hypothetical protein OEY63_00400 [Gemmatimonadota bacterium]|nr:hypothetical protein [Gemmatimonadota bacterium]MDH5803544.1 hypothetical protein [Gemmatimonadota bacterium]